MYQIGPAKVYSNTDSGYTRFFKNLKHKFISNTSTKAFFLEEADHIGHYRMTDSKGGYKGIRTIKEKYKRTETEVVGSPTLSVQIAVEANREIFSFRGH